MPDRFIIDAVQECYDWIFDRTGMYKGSPVQFVCLVYIASCFLYHPKGITLATFSLANLIFIAVHWNIAQKKRSYTALNASALRASQSFYLLFWRIVIFITFSSTGWDICLGFILLLFSYFLCVKVRDREPPESSFFNFNPTGA